MSTHEHANALFKETKYAEAAQEYSALLGMTQDNDLKVTLLSNRAACFLRLGENASAAESCRQALLIDPCHIKSHYRLASAMAEEQEGSWAICAAVALSEGKIAKEVQDLYSRISAVNAWMPQDCKQIKCCSPTKTLQTSSSVTVLRPGRYGTPCGRFLPESATIIGLGTVKVFGSEHAFEVSYEFLHLINLELAGNGSYSAMFVHPTARLLMSRCRVDRYKEAGVLVVGRAELVDCSFFKTGKQAVEVRGQSASIHMLRVTIKDCAQGICAYGGARSVILRDCAITGCAKEGVYVRGTFENAATRVQREINPSRQNIVTERAIEMARNDGEACWLTMSNCIIAKCDLFGTSIDNGAVATIEACRFDSNRIFGVIVKGASNLTISGCQFIFSGNPSNDRHWRDTKQSGLQVGINYEGTVHVSSCAFAGPRELAIVELGAAANRPPFPEACWSRPAKCTQNTFIKLENASTLGELQPSKGAAASVEALPAAGHLNVPSLEQLQRVCRASLRSPWTPASAEFYGFDVTGAASLDKDLHIFLGECGDIRDLLWSIGCAKKNKATVVLNSSNACVLARNAVLLHLIAECKAPPEVVLAVWADHFLADGHAQQLRRSLQQLAEQPWPSWLTASFSTLSERDEAAEEQLRSLFRSWEACAMTPEQLQAERAASVETLSERLSRTTLGSETPTEWQSYLTSGSLTSKPTAVNCTFLLTPDLIYRPYFAIFEAVSLEASGPSLHARLIATLAPRITALVTAVMNGNAHFHLVPRDLVTVLQSSPPSSPKFDFMNFSYAANEISLPLILQLASRVFARASHARLWLESISWEQTEEAVLAEYQTVLQLCILSRTRARGNPLIQRFCFGNSMHPVSLGRFLSIVSSTVQRGFAATAGPVSLVHLISMYAPTQVDLILNRLQSHLDLGLFKWEMQMHALIQTGKPVRIVRLSFDAQANIFDLDPKEQLALVISANALRPHTQPTSNRVKQIISSFAWDNDLGVAHFLFGEALLHSKCGGWFVTLCTLNGNGLTAVGVSTCLRWLPAKPCKPSPWIVDQKGEAGDLSILKESQQWGSKLHMSDKQIVVDVAAPTSFAKTDDVAVVNGPNNTAIDVSVNQAIRHRVQLPFSSAKPPELVDVCCDLESFPLFSFKECLLPKALFIADLGEACSQEAQRFIVH